MDNGTTSVCTEEVPKHGTQRNCHVTVNRKCHKCRTLPFETNFENKTKLRFRRYSPPDRWRLPPAAWNDGRFRSKLCRLSRSREPRKLVIGPRRI